MDGARAAVELFGIEEKKPELLAAGADARADGAARSSGFFSSTSKTLTATSASIKVDPAFGAGADVATDIASFYHHYMYSVPCATIGQMSSGRHARAPPKKRRTEGRHLKIASLPGGNARLLAVGRRPRCA